MDNNSHKAGAEARVAVRPTTTARLISFLLARIAEDEVRAAAGPDSAHADARARRRLIELHSHHDAEPIADPCYTLRLLAERYRNHPDLPPESTQART